MTPPMDKGTQATSQVTSAPQAVSALAQPKLTKITKRAEFLRAANAKRQAAPGFLVQARARNDGDLELRVGFTCSKKIGNAVARNRAKRRLRAVARAILPHGGLAGWDYVLVGRPAVTTVRPFEDLCFDLTRALALIHTKSLT